MITSIPSRYELVSGNGTRITKINMYNTKERLDGGNIYFVKISNYLMKNIPVLEDFIPEFDLNRVYVNDEIKDYKNYYYNFNNLMYVELQPGSDNITYKYDINRAYLTILSPFLDDNKFDYFYKHKEDFVKAVGFCAYRYYIKDTLTNNIIALQNAKRPDILNFCVEALNFLKNSLFEIFPNQLNFYYIDCAGFTLDLDNQLADYGDGLTYLLELFYKKNNIDTKKMKKVTVKNEGKFKITLKDSIYYLDDHPYFALKGNRLYNL